MRVRFVVSSVMTPKERLVTVRENAPKEEVLALLHRHRIEKVLVVTGDHELKGMITVKDFQKATEFPNACSAWWIAKDVWLCRKQVRFR